MDEDPRPVRIVLADDHDVVRMGVRALLERDPGHQVVAESARADQAVSVIARWRPDIAVIDLEMPGGGGFETIAAVREAVPLTRLIVFTVHESPLLAIQAFRLGARGYVVKSAPAARLSQAVKAVHQGQRWVDPEIGLLGFDRLLDQKEEEDAEKLLSPREREVLIWTARGLTGKEIAARMRVGLSSVETFRLRGYGKLGIRSPAELGLFAKIEKWV